MNQIIVKKGKIILENVPKPTISDNTILVEVAYSCISAGTELSTVKSSSESLIQKAIAQPEKVKKLVNMTLDEGLQNTINKIKNKSEQGTPLGYSASGIVKEVGKGITNFKIGDRVACAGAGIANHAEYIEVPKNMAVKIPDGVTLSDASTVTLGCIALQGVRRADVRIGETVIVIGLGILGQITVQLLKAAGCKVIGIDLDERRIKLAEQNGNIFGINSLKSNSVNEVFCLTNGYGADSVIITAATNSSELLSQAFGMCRKKGRVILVGTTGMEIKREDMYQKELDFLISTSYGPGRYDNEYEENGIDYPYAYVRWTENRNMQAYLELIANGRIKLDNIIEAIYDSDEAETAFSVFNSEKKPLIVLLKYNYKEKVTEDIKDITSQPTISFKNSKINIAIVGSGAFAKAVHLPNLQKMGDKYNIYAIMSKTAFNAKTTADQFGAKYSTTSYDEILNDNNVDMVIICTRHNLHAEMAIKAMKKGKAVFLEKPMALNENELNEVISTIEEAKVPFLVGFNRRFSKYVIEIKKHIEKRRNPLIINYQMNAGYVPLDHWVHTHEGGGRVIGEACHIFDLFNFLTDSEVDNITANSITPIFQNISSKDNFITTIKYKDGSICSLTYTALGNSKYPKETCQIFWDNNIINLNNYMSMSSFGTSIKDITSKHPDKGQYDELEVIYNSITQGINCPISIEQLKQTMLMSFLIDNEV